MSKSYRRSTNIAILVSTVAILTVGSTSPLFADTSASIENRDDKPYKIVVEENDTKRELTIGPNEQNNEVCNTICIFELEGDSNAYEIASDDVVVIEDGEIIYEGTDEDGSSDDELSDDNIDAADDDSTTAADDPEPDVE